MPILSSVFLLPENGMEIVLRKTIHILFFNIPLKYKPGS
jgi:hypothetical protein